MLTVCIMLILVAFLGFLVLFVDKKGKSAEFFDKENTNCMRGFWCLIILLVHIPSAYQNPIQDALGSFAYIGVSFFFMTSAYGLMLGVQKNPNAIKSVFWKRRLPKLLIPMLIVNILRVVTEFVALNQFNLLGLVSITGFVGQLLLFYLLFWLVFRFLPKSISLTAKSTILCLAVAVFSVIVYLFEDNLPFGWHVESFGFAYGILLALMKNKFKELLQSRWIIKCSIVCILALVFGVAYLKFKTVVFLGDYLVKILLGLFILLFILSLNSKLSIGNPVSRFMGDLSYEIYLIHDVVFTALTALFSKMNSGLFVLSSIAITVILSVGVNKISNVLLKCFKK